VRFDLPLFKLIQRPLVPISESWIDATPFIVLFTLMFAGGWLLRPAQRGRYTQAARRTTQLVTSFVFIVFIHRCLCALRGWAFGLQMFGRNDLTAFSDLCPFVLMVALTFAFGRIFCGWLCPVGLIQEVLAWVAKARMRLLDTRARLLAGYLVLTGASICVIWIAFLVRPRTQFVPENVAAISGFALLVVLFFALPRERDDRPLKRVRYFAAGAWLLVASAGVLVTNPWCVLYGNEVDYSSIVSLLAVLAGGIVIPMAWCRYLCPLGACLGLAATRAGQRLVNHNECVGCGECSYVCPMGALNKGSIDHTSCTYCGLCIGTCGYSWEREGERSAARAAEGAA
jgi:polyferredoxin